MRALRIGALLVTTGCAWIDNDQLAARLARLDADLDGFDDASVGGDDCDDNDPDVHPDAAERCNGVDDDCDGETDEDPVDPSTFYADADGDSFGDPDAPQTACAAPADTVSDATDCDDDDPTVSPVGTERCDAADVDEDCDGAADDDDLEGAEGTAVGYVDGDSDGFGDAKAKIEACTLPDDTTADATDCADADATTWPGAPEICDGVDHDCDGEIDRSATELCASFGWRITGEEEGSRFGEGVLGGFDLSGSPVDDLVASAPGWAGAVGPSTGSVTLLEGPIRGDRALPDASAIVWTALVPEGAAGATIAPLPSMPGEADGILVGAPRTAGAGAVFLLAADGLTLEATLTGAAGSDAGAAVAPVPGIGGSAAVVGAPGEGGVVFLVRALDEDVSLVDVGATVDGLEIRSEGKGVLPGLGSEVATADLDGDGVFELVLTPIAELGEVVVLDGALVQSTGALTLADADITLTGDGDFGASVFAVGEEEAFLVIGAPLFMFDADRQGSVHVLEGDQVMSVAGTTASSDLATSIWYGAAENDELGRAALISGDLPGDRPLVVGAPGAYDGTGTVYLTTLDECGSCRITDDAIEIRGVVAEAEFGLTLGSGGDLDDDGSDDLIVGAPAAGPGYVFVIPGSEL